MIDVHRFTGRMGNMMFQHAYLYAQMRDGVIPDVYVQDPRYFEDYQDEIRAMYGQDIYPINQVAIHVRRASNPIDPTEPAYVDNPFYIDLFQTDYYKEAMREFPKESFLVFSDDIEWCKKQPIFKGCEFSNGDELTDFNRLAGCKGVIMANSSFSWWAGYLCKGKVVAPKDWYFDGKERTKLLSKWIVI